MIKLYCIVYLLGSWIAHDFKLAHYQLSREGDEINLYITVDREDFLQAIRADPAKKQSIYISNYLKDHLTFYFDNKKVSYQYVSHTENRDFIELNYFMGTYPDPINEIFVYNDVLLEIYERQENIIVSLFRGKKRSFRLNKDKVETTIAY